MKNTFILFLLFIFCFNINAQDTIALKNRKVINAYIIEKSDNKIKYRTESPDNADSTYIIKLSKIKTIRYGNGEVDLLSSQNPRSIFPLGINYGFIVGGGNSLILYYYLIKLPDLPNLFNVFSGSIDYLVTPKISAEVSFLGLFRYPSQYIFSLGGKYWFSNKYGKSGFSPFIGLFYTNFLVENYEYIEENRPRWSRFNSPQVPIGISYITKFGLQTTLQLDNFIRFDSNRLRIPDLIELRIGWRFK